MILVADSGSTKTNWLTDTARQAETMGFNPFFHRSEDILAALQQSDALCKISAEVDKVFFYGAGCSSPERKAIVFQSLKAFFVRAEVHVDHDLNAAAFATYDGRPCIAGIIGTGSNACTYNGSEVDSSQARGLGYILGDEASGSYFGRRLLTAFLYRELPPASHALMQDRYALTKEKILWNVYNEPHANVYMARFAKVLSDSPDRDYMEALVLDGFRDFFRHNVSCFDGYQTMPVHFVGSIAYFFQPLLLNVAGEFGCRLGNVLHQPIFKLMEWHQRAASVE